MSAHLIYGAFGDSSAEENHVDSGHVHRREADHRIANSLSLVAGLLELQANECARRTTMTGEEVARILREGAGRVHLISRLHRLLAQAPDDRPLDLTLFLLEVARTTAGLLDAGGRTRVELHATGLCDCAPALAAPIGLIVAELVTNSIKYAHPAGVEGLVRLDCRHDLDGDLLIQVSDDGVGLPEGFDPMTAASLGMRLVRSLAQQAGADLRFDQDDLGLTVRLKLRPQT